MLNAPQASADITRVPDFFFFLSVSNLMYLVYNRHCVLFWEINSYLKELTICLERQICKKILIIGINYELLALQDTWQPGTVAHA